MIVSGFLGERDLDVRPLDSRLGKVPDISSASLLENGNPVLIVDVDDLVRSIDGLLTGRHLTRVEFARMAERARRRKRSSWWTIRSPFGNSSGSCCSHEASTLTWQLTEWTAGTPSAADSTTSW
jgi:hypothetical protein